MLMGEGDPGGVAHAIVHGRVDIVVGNTAQSAGKVVATCGPGNLVGELSVLDGLPRSATIIAATDVEVCTAQASVSIATLQTLDHAQAAIVRNTARSVRSATEADSIAAGGAPLGLVALWLIDHDPDGGALDYSPAELADALLISRESVSRALSHLATVGAVILDRGRIVILDGHCLDRLAA